MPEHEQGCVQGGKDGFAHHSGGGVEQTAELAAPGPVARKVNQGEKFWQHDDHHADDEDEQGMLSAAPVLQIWIKRLHRDVGKAGKFLDAIDPVKGDQKRKPEWTGHITKNTEDEMHAAD